MNENYEEEIKMFYNITKKEVKPMNPRQEMDGLLNRMFNLFARVTVISKHEEEIGAYIQAQDQAKGLLSKLCTKNLAECVECDGCS